jgi:membrane protein involved in colicin uptake
MTETSVADAGIGHNRPPEPINPPGEEATLADLRHRFPELQATLKDYQAKLATFPKTLTLEQRDTAGALQDLLGHIDKTQKAWKAYRGGEKKRWDVVIKIIQNFFAKGEEQLEAWLTEWRPIHDQYLDLVAAENKRKADEEVKRQAEAAAKARAEQEAAEAAAAKAREEEENARKREEEARARALAAEAEKKAAEEAAARAKAEEERIASEKREREKAEKEQNAHNLREIRVLMKTAESMHEKAEADNLPPTGIEELDDIVRPGGRVSQLAGVTTHSILLDDAQRAEMDRLKVRLNELRDALSRRFNAKEQKRREVERQAFEAEQAKIAAEAAARRKADEEATAKAKAEREAAEAAAAAAKAAQKAAQGDVREARADQREAATDQKGAERTAREAGVTADKSQNRADRLGRKLENTTEAEFSRTRGDFTVGSKTGRWVLDIVDEAALRATMGPLGQHLNYDAIEVACGKWMRAHQESFVGERVEGKLPGVVFMIERGQRIA